jgi:hypothetical protein
MDDLNQPVKKEIKRTILIALGTIILVAVLLYFAYDKHLDKDFFVTMAVVIPIIICSAVISHVYKKLDLSNNPKFAHGYIGFGIVIIAVNIIFIIFGARGLNYYIQIGVGVMSLFYGLRKLKMI